MLLEEIREVIAAPATVNIAERHAKEKGEYAEFKTLFKAKFIQGAAARINPQAKIEGEIIKSRPELVIAAAKAAALEDFLAQHPAELTGQQKLNIITETGRIWNLADHPLIKGILEAESAMSNVFEAYSATPEQRKTWIAAYAKARRKAEALKEAWQYFERELEKRIPKTRIPTATTATTKKKEIDPVAQFVSSLTHLTPKQRRTISWAIQRLDEKGHLSPAESLERFKRYSGPDQHIFAGQLVREHETREEEATGEKLRPKVEPPEGITETPTDLLERIEESKYLDASDIGILRKAITARAFDGERRIAAIKHILLFGLAKETTLFRIARRNLPRRMLPRPFYDEGKQATDELFREGKLVSRPDHPKTAMIANRELMQKYRGTERLL
ncbi:TPA: hypothetical protein HA244_02100 [Candidatus Micrarchaeota archaeon]|nr:hypothetical protein [Candidatus Micrarchaeota archaeon]